MLSLGVRLTSSAFRPSIHNTLVTRHLGTLSRPANASSFVPVGYNLRSNFRIPRFFAGRRGLVTDTPLLSRPSQSETWKRYAITAATVGGAVVALEVFLNRDKREGLSPFEKEYLHEAFQYTGGGLALIALGARGLFNSGAVVRIMSANPWLVLGVGLAGSIGTMMGVYYTPPENSAQKHLFWLGFNACQAAAFSPLFFFSPAILSRAALYTCGVVGSLSYIGATATNDKYLYMGGPLLAGVTVVALSSLAPMVLPLGVRSLVFAESISLYGGLAVFGGFVLYDTQTILHHARMVEAGLMKRDPLKESISLELDMLNIFIRLVQILAMQNNRKK
ncbi:inhibitor of apoptosis-promoting Bax1-domain-containing protein [Gautieria morchelliformis]|nr:inhibitor of apoptosis-promoting Bax1-domain-containing protein [Gautieria morchelliformis]